MPICGCEMAEWYPALHRFIGYFPITIESRIWFLKKINTCFSSYTNKGLDSRISSKPEDICQVSFCLPSSVDWHFPSKWQLHIWFGFVCLSHLSPQPATPPRPTHPTRGSTNLPQSRHVRRVAILAFVVVYQRWQIFMSPAIFFRERVFCILFVYSRHSRYFSLESSRAVRRGVQRGFGFNLFKCLSRKA